MDKNVLITDPKKVANTCNVYFSSIAKELQNKIYDNGKDFSIYLKIETKIIFL